MELHTSGSDAASLHQEVARRLQARDFAGADSLCRVLTGTHPDLAPGWLLASIIAQQLGDFERALESAESAVRLAPADPRCLLRLAQCLGGLDRRAEAIEVAETAARAAGNDAAALDAIGTFYRSIAEHHRSLAFHERAVGLAPDRAAFHFNRALVRRFVGDLEGAEADYDRVLELNPREYEAYVNRSELRTQTAERNHVATLEKLLAISPPDPGAELQLRHALAKEYEDLGRHGESFAELARAARLKRAQMNYDPASDEALVAALIEAFPGAAPAGAPAAGGEAAIFIVGLPRSGSTLVERILSSHSEVVAAGELPHLTRLIAAAAGRKAGRRDLSPAEIARWSALIDTPSLGREYLACSRPAGAPRRFFIDKMPVNFLHCGLIHRALPQAKIIHVARHPLAACYAIYRTLFRSGYPFSYDLDELGRYYISYRRLMAHWRATLPGFIHDLSYERLVADQRGETSRLLEYCGLDWQESCVEFHRTPAPSMTHSAHQVRRPIYDSAVAHWRHYERELEGLRRQLQASGIDLSAPAPVPGINAAQAQPIA
ncbi:MAG: sulfotransferase [Steroidobacteraceae bacterium]